MAKQHRKKKKKKQLSASSSTESSALQKVESVREARKDPYKEMSIQDLLVLCTEHGLILKEEKLLKQYQQSHDIYLLYLDIMKKTDNSFGLDSKAVFTLSEKILDKYFTLTTIPDSYYIQLDARLLEHPQKEQMTAILETAESITDRLINFSFVTGASSFSRFQTMYHMNIAALLVDAFDHLLLSNPSDTHIHHTIRMVQKLCSSYSQEPAFKEDMQALILKWYGYMKAEVKMEELRMQMLKEYPNEPYFIHYALISGLSYGNHSKLCEQYKKKARQYMIFSPREQLIAKDIGQLTRG